MRPRLLLALVALAAACAAPPGDGGGPTASVGTSPRAAASDGTAAADPLAGSAPTLAGGDLELSALRGQALALWFWAPW
ncbi:MAG TPA: hypothetical protein VNU01_13140 [Egibacteraceae bacterium]|nr:hypothetical protein [Egibacteraceae bacterium]